jgi:heterodisulfide reductase subunit C
MVQLGIRTEILSSETLWMCTTCFTCNDRCPQGVEVASIIRVLLNMAVKKGILLSNYKELASNMLKTGYTYRFTKARLRRRTQAKLPTLPKPNLKDIAKLAKITDFSETIES